MYWGSMNTWSNRRRSGAASIDRAAAIQQQRCKTEAFEGGSKTRGRGSYRFVRGWSMQNIPLYAGARAALGAVRRHQFWGALAHGASPTDTVPTRLAARRAWLPAH